jgi:class 3 adenylate cyclase
MVREGQSGVSESDLKRRLAAILAADVAGYSRLMAADDRATVAALDAARKVFHAQIDSNQGRVIDMAGDSVLAVFETATGAVSAALAVQQELKGLNTSVSEDRRMRFRIGVDMGDLIEKADGTMYGDGVNIAARLEGLAEPGGITISDSVRNAVKGKIGATFEDQGEQRVKNIAEPVRAFRVKAEVSSTSKPSTADEKIEQTIRFCSAADGIQLAYSLIGRGPPLVKTGNWMTHLEYDLDSPIWRHLWTELAREHTLVRYDARASGLSDWDVDELSFDTFVADLEAVVEAAGVDQFALLGIRRAAPYRSRMRCAIQNTSRASSCTVVLPWAGTVVRRALLRRNRTPRC